MAYFVVPPEFIPWVSTVVNFVISFTPLISYGSTILSIRKKQSSQGFSIDICGTMLVASILRIFYYFNQPFEIVLLRQCFVMVFIQTILLKVALKYRSYDAVHFEKYHGHWERLYESFKNNNKQVLNDVLTDYEIYDNYEKFELKGMIIGSLMMIFKIFECNIFFIFSLFSNLIHGIIRLFDYHYVRPFYYWQWKNPINYWKFLAGFIMFLLITQILFNKNEYLGVIFGSTSFMVESSLPLPQILLFQRLKHVENFKIILLLSWLGGDFTKISYLFFGTDNVGTLFIFAAFFQMSLNLVITYQFFYYKFNPHNSAINSNEIPVSSYLPTSRRFTTSNLENNLSHSNTIGSSNIQQSVRKSISRASSISLNNVFTNSNSKINIIPQHQHIQHKKSLSQLDELELDDLNFGNKVNSHGVNEDVDRGWKGDGDGVGESNGEGDGEKDGINYADDVDRNYIHKNRSTSIDITDMAIVNDIETAEDIRPTRAGTIHSIQNKKSGENYPVVIEVDE